jgi:hypothetical protein
MRRFNVFAPDFKYAEARPAGYRAGTVRFGPLIGAERMAGTLYELPPGERSTAPATPARAPNARTTTATNA